MGCCTASMVASSEVDYDSLFRPSLGPLAEYFQTGYLAGELFDSPTYERVTDKDLGVSVLKHRDTGIKVWSEARNLLPSDNSSYPTVLFLYTDKDGFASLVNTATSDLEIFASLAGKDKHFKRYTRMSNKEPDGFDSKAALMPGRNQAMNSMSSTSAPSQDVNVKVMDYFCVPILVPESFVSSIWRYTSVDLGGTVDVGDTAWKERLWASGEDQVIRMIEEGMVLLKLAGPSNALEVKRKRVAHLEQVLGQGHPKTLMALDTYALGLQAAGKYAEAEPLYKQVLEYRQRTQGPGDPDTLGALHRVAMLLPAMGRHEEAEALYWPLLQGVEASLGQHHPETLMVMDSLAGLLQAMGKHNEAEPVLRRAIECREKSLGPNHRDTFASMDSLAALLPNVGQHEEAEHLYRRSLAGKEAVLGPNHASVITTLDNLAGLLHSMGRHEEAEPLHWDALEGRVIMLGPNHKDTLASLEDLAALLAAMNKSDMAEPLYRRALEGKELTLGATHPETLATLDNLAALLQAAGKAKDAEPLLQRAFDGRVATMGPRHPDTASSLDSLMKLQKALGVSVSPTAPPSRGSAKSGTIISTPSAGPAVPAAGASTTGVAATLKVDLSQPLGILFESDLTIKEVEDGSQASRLGAIKGWRVTALGGKTLQTMVELESTIKSLKEWGVMQVNATFAPAGSSASSISYSQVHEPLALAEASATAVGATGPRSSAASLSLCPAAGPGGDRCGTLSKPKANANGHEESSKKPLDFDLGQPLGILFGDDLYAKVVQGGSQAEKLGVCKGWKVLSVDGEPLRTPREMEAHMNVLKAIGKRKARIVLTSEKHDKYLDDNYSKASEDSTTDSNDGPARWETEGELGYQRRQLPQERYQELLQCTQRLYGMVRDAPSESENSDDSSEASDTGALPPSRALRPMKPLFDLSKPLGVLFGNKLAVRDVKAGSQAEHLGIRKGLRATAVNGEAVHRLKALEAKILVLKTKGTSKVAIHFAPVVAHGGTAPAPRDTCVGR